MAMLESDLEILLKAHAGGHLHVETENIMRCACPRYAHIDNSYGDDEGDVV